MNATATAWSTFHDDATVPLFGTDNGPPCRRCAGHVYGMKEWGDPGAARPGTRTFRTFCYACHLIELAEIPESAETAKDMAAAMRRARS